MPGSQYISEQSGLLIYQALIDRALQRVLPELLQPQILDLSHYLLPSGHSGKNYEQHALPWLLLPHMTKEVYDLGKTCLSCYKKRIRCQMHRYLKIFPTRGSLRAVAKDISRTPPKTASAIRQAVVMINRHAKLTWAVPGSKKTDLSAASTSLDNCIVSYNISSFLLTDSGMQIVKGSSMVLVGS